MSIHVRALLVLVTYVLFITHGGIIVWLFNVEDTKTELLITFLPIWELVALMAAVACYEIASPGNIEDKRMNVQIGPSRNVGCLTGRYIPYSGSRKITMHNQTCVLADGNVKLYNLKLYLKNNRQYARTVGLPRNRTFRKEGKVWIQVLK